MPVSRLPDTAWCGWDTDSGSSNQFPPKQLRSWDLRQIRADQRVFVCFIDSHWIRNPCQIEGLKIKPDPKKLSYHNNKGVRLLTGPGWVGMLESVFQAIMLKLCYYTALCPGSQLAIDYCIDCSCEDDDSYHCDWLLLQNWLPLRNLRPTWSRLSLSRDTIAGNISTETSTFWHNVELMSNVVVC